MQQHGKGKERVSKIEEPCVSYLPIVYIVHNIHTWSIFTISPVEVQKPFRFQNSMLKEGNNKHTPAPSKAWVLVVFEYFKASKKYPLEGTGTKRQSNPKHHITMVNRLSTRHSRAPNPLALLSFCRGLWGIGSAPNGPF